MQEIGPLAAAQGLEIFDLDLPDQRTGIVRIFVSKPAPQGRVSVDDCAALSRRLSVHERLGAWLGSFTLEVSSPGINRRLQYDAGGR